MDKIDERILREKIKARQYARDHIHRVFYKRGEYAVIERMLITDSLV